MDARIVRGVGRLGNRGGRIGRVCLSAWEWWKRRCICVMLPLGVRIGRCARCRPSLKLLRSNTG